MDQSSVSLNPSAIGVSDCLMAKEVSLRTGDMEAPADLGHFLEMGAAVSLGFQNSWQLGMDVPS